MPPTRSHQQPLTSPTSQHTLVPGVAWGVGTHLFRRSYNAAGRWWHAPFNPRVPGCHLLFHSPSSFLKLCFLLSILLCYPEFCFSGPANRLPLPNPFRELGV